MFKKAIEAYCEGLWKREVRIEFGMPQRFGFTVGMPEKRPGHSPM